MSAVSYSRDDFGPSHRWVVFACSKTGHPMHVAYEQNEYDTCDCGAPLIPIDVSPDEEQS